MSLKRKITKAEYDALTDVRKELYTASGDNFILDAEPDDDVSELLRARDREKADAAEAKRLLAELQAEKDERLRLERDGLLDDATKSKDIDKLQKIWTEERDQREAAHTAKLTQREKQLQKLLVDDRAEAISKELSPNAWEVLLPHIKMRLAADLDSDSPAVKVLTIDGQPSTLNVEELKKEFLSKPAFASILGGVNSSGSGATGNGGGGASKKPSEYTEAERVELYRTNPGEFARLFQQA